MVSMFFIELTLVLTVLKVYGILPNLDNRIICFPLVLMIFTEIVSIVRIIVVKLSDRNARRSAGSYGRAVKWDSKTKTMIGGEYGEHHRDARGICGRCQYIGDKYSFPMPNNLVGDDENGKRFYCCCGDCDLYGKDVTSIEMMDCDFFEEL